jgi:Cd2+/Zn2+-exporting ATPase
MELTGLHHEENQHTKRRSRMEAVIKKEYLLEGLGCPMCAEKMQEKIRKLEAVRSAVVDFPSQRLSLEVDGGVELADLITKADKIIKRYEPSVRMSEMESANPAEKALYLVGLDCADCANKIEEAINRLNFVKSASLDFVSGRLRIEVSDREKLPSVIRQASKIASEIEPKIQISLTDRKEAEAKSAEDWKERLSFAGVCVGAAIFAVAVILPFLGLIPEFEPQTARALCLLSYLLVGGEVLLRALKNISKGQVFDENFLMSVASIGAITIGDHSEAAAVMLFYQVGEAFQRIAVNRSRKSISALMDIRPDFANLKTEGGIQTVSPEMVGVGDYIVVKPGEKIPLDGVVTDGISALDTSALTGEALPRDVFPGSEALSGSINKNGLLTVRVSKEFGESTVSKILDLVQNSSGKKAPIENFITKFARYYTPAVVFTAIALAIVPPLVITGASFSDWLHRALVFLVVSCPCALVISIPLGLFGGIGSASKNGILIKGSNYLEALKNVDTVVFDKTGTLTKGVFKVSRIVPSDKLTEEELLSLAAYAESASTHPIAVSIRNACGNEIDARKIGQYEEIAGQGVHAQVDGKAIWAGNDKLMASENIPYVKVDTLGTTVHIAIDRAYAGHIVISDEMKPDSKAAVAGLKALGVRNIAMLTGDSRAVGEAIAHEIGLDTVYAELLPHQKVEQLEEIEKRKTTDGKLVFVGDGINDAPVLARSDVGFAMGGVGSDAAIEAADVVLMTDEPSKLITAIRIAKKTHHIVWQNIAFALAVKGVILVLGATGIASMWAAVFGDVGVAVIAVLNAMRAMRV